MVTPSPSPNSASEMPPDVVRLAADLYQFMLSAERLLPSGSAEHAKEAVSQVLERGRDLQQRIASARGNAAHKASGLLEDAHTHLRTFTAAVRAKAPDVVERRREAFKALSRNYEALHALIKQQRLAVPKGLRLGHLKPKNYARNLFHVAMAVTGVATYELTGSKTVVLWISGILLSGFIALEVGRRVSERFNERLVQSIFGAISRPGEEHHVPAATWYMLSLLIGIALLPQHAIEIGTLALGFGDPAASLAGKRFGRIKLVGDKSVAGSIGFVLATSAALTVFVLLCMPHVTGMSAVWLVAISAVAGAITELFTGRIDDNFTIPLAVGAVAALVMM